MISTTRIDGGASGHPLIETRDNCWYSHLYYTFETFQQIFAYYSDLVKSKRMGELFQITEQ